MAGGRNAHSVMITVVERGPTCSVSSQIGLAALHPLTVPQRGGRPDPVEGLAVDWGAFGFFTVYGEVLSLLGVFWPFPVRTSPKQERLCLVPNEGGAGV